MGCPLPSRLDNTLFPPLPAIDSYLRLVRRVLGELLLVVGPGHSGAHGVLVLRLTGVEPAGVARVSLLVLLSMEAREGEGERAR